MIVFCGQEATFVLYIVFSTGKTERTPVAVTRDGTFCRDDRLEWALIFIIVPSSCWVT